MMSLLSLGVEAARKFLNALDSRGKFTFQTFDDGKKVRKHLARVLHGTLDQHAATLTALNNDGAGVFVMVNGGDLKGRKQENVSRVRALFVDLDGAPLEPVLAFPLHPHVIVESSPGRWHAYWIVSDCPLDRFSDLQTRLADHFDGDTSVKDLPRVMRVPGFLHRKGEPVMTTLQEINPIAPYAVADIEQVINVSATPRGTPTANATTKDWNAPFLSGVPIDPASPSDVGERNNGAARYAGSLIAQGKTDEEVLAEIRQWNADLAAPLPDDEVRAVCKSIRRKHERKDVAGPRGLPADAISTAFAATPGAPIEWDDPIAFSDVPTPDIPARLLPGVLGDFAHALANSTETPEAMAVMTVLGVVSVAAAKRFVVSPKPGWMEPVNIYTLIALPPGNNKSLVLNACTKPLVEWEIAQAAIVQPEITRQLSERKTQEKIIDSLRSKVGGIKDTGERRRMIAEITELDGSLGKPKTLPKLFSNDATPEALGNLINEQGGRFAVISDEGGIIETLSGLYTGGSANIDPLLKAFDGGHLRVQRKDRSFDVNPYLTLVLAVQPRIICNMGDKRAFQGNGLLERFLYVLPHSKLGFRTHDKPPVPHEFREAFHQTIRKLLDIPALRGPNDIEVPRTLTLASDAYDRWREFQRTIEAGLAPDGVFDAFQGWAAKVSGYALRIAGLLHVAEHGDRVSEICLETMVRALTIAAALIIHAKAAFGMIHADSATEDAKAVWRWIRRNKHGRFRKTACLMENKGRFTKVDRLNAALRDLTERNMISAPVNVVTTPGKRASTEYLVNPAALA